MKKEESISNFEELIQPFYWVEHDGGDVSLCLAIDDYKMNIFATREEDGFLGSGDDWASLALVFLDEKMNDLKDLIDFDPESSMFCAYSSDSAALKKFAIGFKELCDNEEEMLDLFSRAELD